MATNQTENIRTIPVAIDDIPGLTPTQILQLIQSETTAGAQADVSKLQVGDIVAIVPGNVEVGVIDEDHGDVTAGEDEAVKRIFLVTTIGGAGGSVPPQRNVLMELSVTNSVFW